MNSSPPPPSAAAPLSPELMERRKRRAQELLDAQVMHVYKRRDRLFGWLMGLQWLFALLLAYVCSPKAWAGTTFATHVHVYYVLTIGTLISGVPMVLVHWRPGAAVTRYTVAVCQMLWSGLLVHLTGGRIETHFHVFVSLALLSFYRDWRVLIPATLTVVVDHLLRGVTYPQSVYGITNPEWWRFLEHAGWALFEDAALIMGIFENIKEMRVLSQRWADTELQLNLRPERIPQESTSTAEPAAKTVRERTSSSSG